ncbi:carbohydrate ABC transporter permease [Pumilibacter intestinalis]|uniref:carbohydrate ABC transporter permease n=1 Tax=Pumilibacter intestinalis TaxID=2941511 RepID=UPI00203C1FAB|nr:sugar ABC transporter permease [Pumilibacter intestinalis]
MIGIVLFNFIPMGMSLYYSFSTYDIISPPRNFGWHNYTSVFTDVILRDKFFKSLLHTGEYLLFSILVGLVLSFLLALFLNQKLKGMGVYRVLYYLPNLLPPVCAAIVWADITDPLYGLGNSLLGKIGLGPYTFYSDPNTAMPTFLLLALWGLGSGLMLWMAQFQNIPNDLYEAADLEGAGVFRKCIKITIPMSTPTIFYTLINSIIAGLQIFGPYLIAGAGPDDSLLFYVTNIYINHREFNMGFACALSWMLFLVIAAFTLVLFKKSKWVFYGEDM